MRALLIFLIALLIAGCTNTWKGIKEDTKDVKEWTKEKINQGATYVKEKTE